MLPDLIRVKVLIHKKLMEFVRARTNFYKTGLEDVGLKILHEGHKSGITRKGQPFEESAMQHFQSKLEFDLDQIRAANTNEIFQKLDLLSYKIANFQIAIMHEKIKAATETTGNQIPLDYTPDMIFQAMEKVDVQFDNEGKMLSRFYESPFSQSKIKPILDQINNDPDLLEKYNKLVQQKYQEFIARENNRKLVI